MPIQKITIEQFLQLSGEHPVIDVRSPGEYNHAHIPGALSLPLFTDEERKIVGTAYKQQLREAAIKIGLDFFGVKMRKMVEEVEAIVDSRQEAAGSGQWAVGKEQPADRKLQTANCVLLHCWRGGMRSAAVAWLLDMYGFRVYTLNGGYKAYRKWVLAQFEKEYDLRIVGGYTGSGKTALLHQLKAQNKIIIDLEALANHKGSAFGDMGKQPGQEMFENILAEQLYTQSTVRSGQWAVGKEKTAAGELPTVHCELPTSIYIEDESQRIGSLQIPMPFWYTMRKSQVYFLDIPFEERLKYITEDYGRIEKEKLADCIMRIQKRLGGLETKNALNFLEEDKHEDCFRILLGYYDKWYTKALHNREGLSTLLNKIPCKDVDIMSNVQKLLSCDTVTT